MMMKLEREIDWSDLPGLVLWQVADKLNLATEFTRFGAVCTSWQAIYGENRDHKLRDPLLLILPDENNKDGQARVLYSLNEKRVYKNIKLSIPYNELCVGSSHGWLAMLSRVSQRDYQVRLVNPLLSENNEIKLPPLIDWDRNDDDEEGFVEGNYEIYDFVEYPNYERFDFSHLRKVVVSADPMSSPNYTVVAIHADCNLVSFYKPGDKTWTCLGLEMRFMADIVYDNQVFYVLQYTSGQVFSCDLNGPSPIISMVGPTPPKKIPQPKYLIKTASELLQVRRILAYDEVRNDSGTFDYYYYTEKFEVLRFENGEWNVMETLDGQILFLGDNSSLLLSTSDMPGCKPNCIYFTDNKHEGYYNKPEVGPHDMGVFCLEDKSMQFFKRTNGSIQFFDFGDDHIHQMKTGIIGPAPIMIQTSLNCLFS